MLPFSFIVMTRSVAYFQEILVGTLHLVETYTVHAQLKLPNFPQWFLHVGKEIRKMV